MSSNEHDAGVLIREDYWDERIKYYEGGLPKLEYAYGGFTRWWLHLIYGEGKLP